MTRGSESLYLSIGTIGKMPILDDAAISAIVERTGLSWRSGFDEAALKQFLNDLVDQTLHRMFARPTDRRKFEALKKHFDEYERLSSELAHSRDFPPRLPREWYLTAKSWFVDMAEEYENRSRGGRPKKVQLDFFLPRAIGLYASAFGKKPVSTTRGETGKDGPTAGFLRETLRQIDNALREAKFDEKYSFDEVAKFRDFKTTDDGLRVNIDRAMNVESFMPSHKQSPAPRGRRMAKWPDEKLWGAYATMFDELCPAF